MARVSPAASRRAGRGPWPGASLTYAENRAHTRLDALSMSVISTQRDPRPVHPSGCAPSRGTSSPTCVFRVRAAQCECGRFRRWKCGSPFARSQPRSVAALTAIPCRSASCSASHVGPKSPHCADRRTPVALTFFRSRRCNGGSHLRSASPRAPARFTRSMRRRTGRAISPLSAPACPCVSVLLHRVADAYASAGVP